MNINKYFPKTHTIDFMKSLLKEYLTPPPNISVSEWADKYRILPKGTGSEPGKWRTKRTPYLKEILDCLSSDEVIYIVIMSCNQIGKGEVINNGIAYYIDCRPAPMLMVQPTVEAAEGYSKTKLAPMFEETRVLKNKMEGFQQNIREKKYPGGFLKIVGANSPAGLASNTVRVAFLDEVDRFAPGAKNEGDQIELAIKRTDNYSQSRKIVITSTPGEEETSKVYDWYMRSSQEVWSIPCPSCGEFTNPTIEDFDPEELTISCKKCGCIHDEFQWKKAQSKGKYIANNPNNRKIRGFHLNAFSSPWLSWETIGMEYIAAKKDALKMTVFMNTRMGLPWKGVMGLDNTFKEIYLNNKGDYKAQLHKDTLLLTAAIDIQDKWGIVEVVGWGYGERSFGVECKIFKGDPDTNEFWKQIDEYLERDFVFENGKKLKIKMTFIDTGGHKTQSTYNYLYGKEKRGIYGIKGDNTRKKGYIVATTTVNKSNGKPITLIRVGVNDLKSLVYERLSAKEGEHGYCYFPKKRKTGYTEEYFKGLFSERKVITTNRYGYKVIQWEKIRKRNEPLDIRVYATAALKQLNPDFKKLEEELKENKIKLIKKKKGKIKLLKKGGVD